MGCGLGELGHRTGRVHAQVPANRIGYAGGYSLAQLKISQEVITLAVFVPFSIYYMGQPFKWDYVWAGLCLMGRCTSSSGHETPVATPRPLEFEFPRTPMLFGKLLPKEGNFFDLFNQHGTHIAEGARAFMQMIENYADPLLRQKYADEVDHAEHAADRVTAEVNRLLHLTFITPIDREQIHGLINAMDDILDLLQDSSETMSLYDVRAIPRMCCAWARSACAAASACSMP